MIAFIPMSYGAIPADAVWEMRSTTGDNTNGACVDKSVVAGTTDYSQQAAAQLSLTDLATTGAAVTTLTSATGGFTSQMVGNCLRVNSGTNATVGYYMITAYTDTNTVTLDRAPDDGVGGVASGAGKVGGATASIDSQTTSTLADALIGGNTIYIKNEAGWSENITISVGNIAWVGYNSTRTDAPTGSDRPVLDLNSGAGDAIVTTAGGQFLQNLIIREAGDDCLGHGSAYIGTGFYLINTRLSTCGAAGVSSNNNRRAHVKLYYSEIDGCTTSATSMWQANKEGSVFSIGSDIHGNAGGLHGGSITSYFNNIYDNTADGIGTTGHGHIIFANTIDGNTGVGVDGISATGGGTVNIISNNIMSNNGGYGLTFSSAISYEPLESLIDYNDYYLNTSGTVNNGTPNTNSLTLNPNFTDADNGDFSIGTNLKAKGFSDFPAGTSTGYLDLGAVQREESGGATEHSYTFS